MPSRAEISGKNGIAKPAPQLSGQNKICGTGNLSFVLGTPLKTPDARITTCCLCDVPLLCSTPPRPPRVGTRNHDGVRDHD